MLSKALTNLIEDEVGEHFRMLQVLGYYMRKPENLAIMPRIKRIEINNGNKFRGH